MLIRGRVETEKNREKVGKIETFSLSLPGSDHEALFFIFSRALYSLRTLCLIFLMVCFCSEFTFKDCINLCFHKENNMRKIDELDKKDHNSSGYL